MKNLKESKKRLIGKVGDIMDLKNIKTELFNDNFQNYKRYGIPKAQLVIADIPYNVGTNFYGSNPMWYKGGDNKNGESKLAGKAAFNTDFNFNLYEYFHFCSKLLKKEDTKPVSRGRSSTPLYFIGEGCQSLETGVSRTRTERIFAALDG